MSLHCMDILLFVEFPIRTIIRGKGDDANILFSSIILSLVVNIPVIYFHLVRVILIAVNDIHMLKLGKLELSF